MLQPGLLSVRPSVSSDPENPRMALGLGGRPGSRGNVVAETKMSPLVLGSNTNKALLFCRVIP